MIELVTCYCLSQDFSAPRAYYELLHTTHYPLLAVLVRTESLKISLLSLCLPKLSSLRSLKHESLNYLELCCHNSLVCNQVCLGMVRD